MRILHLLQNSLPKISGSTIRTKYIFKYQKKFARIIALTSHLFEESDKDLEIIEGIPYYRINKRIRHLIRFVNKYMTLINRIIYKLTSFYLDDKLQDFFVKLFMKYYISKLVNFYNIDIIHGHSHHKAAKYGLSVARKKKIPFIYEVRGFIEENFLAKIKHHSLDHNLIKQLYNNSKRKETDLMKSADRIITLSAPMKKEIVLRGIPKKKINIIPNGTDTELLHPIKTDEKLLKKFNLREKKIIGFIGRLTWYEGINVLLKSVPTILKENKNIKILLIGKIEKSYLKYLVDIIIKLRIGEYVQILGPIPHDKIQHYYSIIDIIVLPRLNIKVSRLVTPLKHLEAMAFKTLVIASDYPAFRFTITEKKNGDFFKPEDSNDLAKKICYYLKNPEEKRKIEEYARSFVENQYHWEKLVLNYKTIYLTLLEKRNHTL